MVLDFAIDKDIRCSYNKVTGYFKILVVCGGDLARKRIYRTAAEKQKAYRQRKFERCNLKPVTRFVPVDLHEKMKDDPTMLLGAYRNSENVNFIDENLSSAVVILGTLNKQGAFAKLMKADQDLLISAYTKLEEAAARFRDGPAAARNEDVIAHSEERTGSGTKEWAERNINICLGCSHDCLYCYARNFAWRRKAIRSRADWANERVLQEKVDRGQGKKKGLTMFPSTHDITPGNLKSVTEVLGKMMAAGNKVLLVTKPHPECIESLCRTFEEYKDQILFRFTIGTLNSEVSKFWEPGAPDPAERIESLKHAFNRGFKTSVSCEPMLEGIDGILNVFKEVAPFVTDTIWIGKMNKPNLYVDRSVPANVLAIRELKKSCRVTARYFGMFRSFRGLRRLNGRFH